MYYIVLHLITSCEIIIGEVEVGEARGVAEQFGGQGGQLVVGHVQHLQPRPALKE